MNLPQELLDEIFGYLPSDGGKTLRACSLVAKLWVYPAQRLLFYTVNLNAQTYWLWKQRISPANTGLLSHVRSLTYILTDAQPVLWTPYALIDYLPSFCQLQSLTLCNMRIDSDFSKQVEISPFRHTLSSLQLSKVSLPWIAFATLVDSFPSLRNLDIYAPCYDEDNRRPTTLSRPLRGKIAVDMSMEEALVAFSDRLPGMRVEYDELTLYGSYFRSTPRCYQRIVNTCGKSLQRLNLHPKASPLDLSGCPGLQRLQFFIVFDERERAVISSITSTSIRAIVFTPYLAHAAFRKILENPEPFIPPLDNILSTLVDRLRASGYKHTLVLEFRLIDLISGYTLDLKKSLPKFREKGRVILKHWLTEETIELS